MPCPRPALGSASVVDPTGAWARTAPSLVFPGDGAPSSSRVFTLRKETPRAVAAAHATPAFTPSTGGGTGLCAQPVSQLERRVTQCKKCTVQPRWLVERVLYI